MKPKLLYEYHQKETVNLVSGSKTEQRDWNGCVLRLPGNDQYPFQSKVFPSCTEPHRNGNDADHVNRLQEPKFTFNKLKMNDGIYISFRSRQDVNRLSDIHRHTIMGAWPHAWPYLGEGFWTSHILNDGSVDFSHIIKPLIKHTYDKLKPNEDSYHGFSWFPGGELNQFLNGQHAVTATSEDLTETGKPISKNDQLYFVKPGGIYCNEVLSTLISKTAMVRFYQLIGSKSETLLQAKALAKKEYSEIEITPPVIEPPQEDDYQKGIADQRKDTKAAWDNFKDVSGIE